MAGTYVGLPLTKGDAIYLTNVVKVCLRDKDVKQSPHLEIESEPHCTAIYSRQSIPGFTPTGLCFFAKITDVVWWEGHDQKGYVVALLDSKDIKELNDHLVELGGVNSFSEYRPHLTLLYGGDAAEEAVGKEWALALKKLLKGEEVTFEGEQVRPLN